MKKKILYSVKNSSIYDRTSLKYEEKKIDTYSIRVKPKEKYTKLFENTQHISQDKMSRKC